MQLDVVCAGMRAKRWGEYLCAAVGHRVTSPVIDPPHKPAAGLRGAGGRDAASAPASSVGQMAAEVEGRPKRTLKQGDPHYVERERWHGKGRRCGTDEIALT